MKWIKAKERMPDKTKIGQWFNCKLNGHPAGCAKLVKPVGQDKIMFDIDKYGLTDLNDSKVEWLDESINEPFDDGLFEGIYNKFCDYYEDDGSNEEQKRNNLKSLLSQIPYMICEYCCEHCGDPIEHPICRNCEIQLTLPDTEY